MLSLFLCMLLLAVKTLASWLRLCLGRRIFNLFTGTDRKQYRFIQWQSQYPTDSRWKDRTSRVGFNKICGLSSLQPKTLFATLDELLSFANQMSRRWPLLQDYVAHSLVYWHDVVRFVFLSFAYTRWTLLAIRKNPVLSILLDSWRSHSGYSGSGSSVFYQVATPPLLLFTFLFSNVSIVLMDRVDGPFKLEVDYIGVVNDTTHEEDFAYEKYSLPVYTVVGI